MGGVTSKKKAGRLLDNRGSEMKGGREKKRKANPRPQRLLRQLAARSRRGKRRRKGKKGKRSPGR